MIKRHNQNQNSNSNSNLNSNPSPTDFSFSQVKLKTSQNTGHVNYNYNYDYDQNNYKREPLGRVVAQSSRSNDNYQNQHNVLKNIYLNQKQKRHNHFYKQNFIGPDATFNQDPNLQSRTSQFKTKRMLCQQCFIYSLKIEELTSTYQQLIMCKNQQIFSCRDIIGTLQQKVKDFQTKYREEIQKNTKFKHYVETKLFSQNNIKKEVSQAVQYLKKRQLSLLQNLKTVQNELYVKDLHLNDYIPNKKQKYLNNNYSQQNNYLQTSQSYQNKIMIDKEYNITNQNQQKQQKQQKQHQFQFQAINASEFKNKDCKIRIDLPQISMHQYIKKCNELELVNDNNLIFKIQAKIKNLKYLEAVLLAK